MSSIHVNSLESGAKGLKPLLEMQCILINGHWAPLAPTWPAGRRSLPLAQRRTACEHRGNVS